MPREQEGLIIITRTTHSEALIVRGTGCDVVQAGQKPSWAVVSESAFEVEEGSPPDSPPGEESGEEWSSMQVSFRPWFGAVQFRLQQFSPV